jgi:hypothetical protein
MCVCFLLHILDSKQSDDYIDFTMLCVFFLYFFFTSSSFRAVKVLRFSSSASFSDRKVNLVSTLGVKSKKFPIVFKHAEKNKQKKKKLRKTGIFWQSKFLFLM